MRHSAIFAALLIAAGVAAPRAAAAEVKVGYVNIRRAALEVEDGKSAAAQLKKEGEEKQKKLDARGAELKRLQADLEKQAMVLSDKAKGEKAAELQQKYIEAQQLRAQMDQELSMREQQLLNAIVEKMEPIVREIAEADGITFVLEKGAVVYGPSALDLTNELIRKYNARAKPAAAPKK